MGRLGGTLGLCLEAGDFAVRVMLLSAAVLICAVSAEAQPDPLSLPSGALAIDGAMTKGPAASSSEEPKRSLNRNELCHTAAAVAVVNNLPVVFFVNLI